MNTIRYSSLLGTGLALVVTLGCSCERDHDGSAPSATASATVALASSESAPAQARRAEPGSSAFMEKFDGNRNGKLEPNEAPERFKTEFEAQDVDKDGALSSDELKAGLEAGRAKRFAADDKNGDHALDANELGQRFERLKVADANGDGKVTEQELRDAFQSGKLQGRGSREEHGPRERAPMSGGR